MEVWKIIAGFNYSVSSGGRVKSNKSGRIIKPWSLRQGYLQVGLMLDGKRHRLLVHRLVAEAFLIKQSHQYDVNHIDLNKANNSIENLEWVSKSENMQHASSSGALGRVFMRYSPEFIKEVLNHPAGILETCRLFGIHPSTFWNWRNKFRSS